MLRFRREDQRELFERGALPAARRRTAQRRDHVFAFARRSADRHALVAVPRLVATLLPDAGAPPIGERVWGDTRDRAAGGPRRADRLIPATC